jgi:hypothetical protein
MSIKKYAVQMLARITVIHLAKNQRPPADRLLDPFQVPFSYSQLLVVADFVDTDKLC